VCHSSQVRRFFGLGVNQSAKNARDAGNTHLKFLFSERLEFLSAMQFLPHGPDIPDELVKAQEKGQTIFVCGAGVSRTVGLPLFRGLVEGIYQKLGEDWTFHPAECAGMREGGRHVGQYDRVLRCLERRLGASDSPRNRGMRERIRAAVRELLAPPNDADLPNHLALLKLSRDAEGCVRLLTTNFDTLFERAWLGEHQSPIESHAGSAMPQPKTARCTGVLHLHGRLADPRPELERNRSGVDQRRIRRCLFEVRLGLPLRL
jgi:hypothetical protein